MSDLAAYLVQVVVTLVAIIALAILVLYGARRVGIGRPSGPIDLLGRLPLDGRRTVYLVRVAGRVYVVGGSEAGLEKLGELPADSIDLESLESEPIKFSEALSRALSKKKTKSGVDENAA